MLILKQGAPPSRNTLISRATGGSTPRSRGMEGPQRSASSSSNLLDLMQGHLLMNTAMWSATCSSMESVSTSTRSIAVEKAWEAR